MPRLVEGCEQAGKLGSALAQEWGVGDVVVAGGAGDNAATACGFDVTRPGGGVLVTWQIWRAFFRPHRNLPPIQTARCMRFTVRSLTRGIKWG